jgi:hypothetical protein
MMSLIALTIGNCVLAWWRALRAPVAPLRLDPAGPAV